MLPILHTLHSISFSEMFGAEVSHQIGSSAVLEVTEILVPKCSK